jgi:hypothetical protein
MLLKAEFEANLSFLEPSIESMLAAGQGKSYPKISMSLKVHKIEIFFGSDLEICTFL